MANEERKPIYPDRDLRNADWLRTMTWDLPTDPDIFLAVIGGRTQLDHFMTLPAAEAMPNDLKVALGLAHVPTRGRARVVPKR